MPSGWLEGLDISAHWGSAKIPEAGGRRRLSIKNEHHAGGSPLPQPNRFSKSKSPEPRLRDISRAARVLQRAQWFVDALGGHLEGAEMHTDALGCLKIQVRLHRLRRIHVNDLHEPARLIGTDRQQCEVDWTEPLPDVVKEGGVRGVAGEKYARAAWRQHEPTPQGAVSIQRTPCREVLRRGQRDR